MIPTPPAILKQTVSDSDRTLSGISFMNKNERRGGMAWEAQVIPGDGNSISY